MLFLRYHRKKRTLEPVICMGGSFLAQYSPGPGAGGADTCVAITGEEPVLAMVAMAMIRNGERPAEPISPAGNECEVRWPRSPKACCSLSIRFRSAVKDSLSIDALSG